ncbi:MAG TPA: hypothetical protein VHF65_07545 [Nitrososphaera sp.]|nr:hypothetical protein [Nitrososphaera sp.]
MISNNIAIQGGIRPSLVQELESLGLSLNNLDFLNDSGELDNLTDNIKQEFMNEIREMEEQGFFVNLGGG